MYQSNKFGIKFDAIYAQASERAVTYWEEVAELCVRNPNGPLKLEHLDSLTDVRNNYYWYFTEQATRGAWLQWSVIELPLHLRLRDREACMRRLLKLHRENHDRLSRVKTDLLEAGIPECYLHSSYRETLAPTT